MLDNGNGEDEGGFSTQGEPVFKEGRGGREEQPPRPPKPPPTPPPQPSEKKGD